MKKILPAIVFALFGNLLIAQVTVTNATFPAVGDTLKTATDLNPSGVTITAPAGNSSWDFSSLKISLAETFAFRNANEGSISVPGANMFVAIGQNSEAYYNVSATKLELIGVLGPDPLGFTMDALYKFSPPLVERRAPLTYPAVNNSSSALNIPFKTSDLPPFLVAILDSLPGPTPDSFRIKIKLDRTDFVDAWGKLAIPGGTYDVLREKSTETTETRIEIKVPLIGWWDITDLFPIPNTGGNTSISYTFWNDVAKEPIAIVQMDSTGANVEQVTFKNNGVLSAGEDEPTVVPTVRISPNPVVSDARFEFLNVAQGDYTLQIINLKGEVVLEKNLRLNISYVESVDMSALATGQYFYTLSDKKGSILASGKLVKH
jgi:hypothetical protein